MRIILYVIGALLILSGGVWFLQGINVLPGSFMTGQIQWAFYGAIAMAAGIGLLVFANQRKKSKQSDKPGSDQVTLSAALPRPATRSHMPRRGCSRPPPGSYPPHPGP